MKPQHYFKEALFAFGTALCTIAVLGLVYNLTRSIFNRTVKPVTNQEYSSTSVMITRYDGRSGGTGVILSSEKGQSKILTNAHVCELLFGGGIISSDKARGTVKYFQISSIHDLCLVTTNNNFHINTVISSSEPEAYDEAIVSGHPHLLPNIITRGHFSQKEIINVIVGFKPCTIEDVTNDALAEYCNELGFIPIIRRLEAQVVSATIMPGSSGSAVFNTRGEISGLVFAGAGDFGYGFVVPYEYIMGFVNFEVDKILPVYPRRNFTVDKNNNLMDIKQACTKASSKKVLEVCELFLRKLISIK